jgi:hypothetical protein
MDVFVAGTGSFAAEIVDWARAAGARVVGLIELLDFATLNPGVNVGGNSRIEEAEEPGV